MPCVGPRRRARFGPRPRLFSIARERLRPRPLESPARSARDLLPAFPNQLARAHDRARVWARARAGLRDERVLPQLRSLYDSTLRNLVPRALGLVRDRWRIVRAKAAGRRRRAAMCKNRRQTAAYSAVSSTMARGLQRSDYCEYAASRALSEAIETTRMLGNQQRGESTQRVVPKPSADGEIA